ncbi:MAG: DUF58 domain-containing protein [Actinomycetota bacterium]|nr:DUF58 domain-containing protein [Actinomycetota bacterium]
MSGLTERGRLVLLLAVGIYLVAWGFGSRSLYPVATGLALAVLGARIWVAVAQQPVVLRRSLGSSENLEGGDVTVGLEARPQRHPGPRSLEVVERAGRLGEQRTRLVRHGGSLLARYVLTRVPRGRYRFEAVRAVFEDPFALARAEIGLGGESTLLVYPRLVDLDRLFTQAGGTLQMGGRVLLRRTAGFDLHSVRQYQEGESLRKVHWRSTARRGTLMVKELEDTPHDEVAVLLDADARTVVGESFDVQVRVAGSIVRAHALRSRRAVLTLTTAPPESCQIASFDGEWRLALELLSAAEPNGTEPLARFLHRDASPAARANELVVVTASLGLELADALLERALARRPTSLVLVEAASFGPNGSEPLRDPALLRLQMSGVPVAVVRRGDDLAAKLSGLDEAVVTHG